MGGFLVNLELMKHYLFRLLAIFMIFSLAGCSFDALFGGATKKRVSSGYRTVTGDGVTLYLTAAQAKDAPSVEAFFRSNMMMVSQVKKKADDGKRYWVDYPSVNSGPSPRYSHRITIQVPSGLPVSLGSLVGSSKYGVFIRASGADTWRLVGYASSGSGEAHLDWFGKHPQLRFKS